MDEVAGPDHHRAARILPVHNADPYARDADGDTLLHCAAIAGQLEVVQLLLKLNAEVNSLNNEGSTPIP